MRVNLDKKALGYSAKLTLLIIIILSEGRFIAATLTQILTPAPEIPSVEVSDQGRFYLEPPDEKPIFLTAKEILKKRDALTWEGKDFLYADLEAMALMRYEKGALRQTYPIVARPKVDSFFDTPSGLYKIQSKTENHFSRIENVRLPSAIFLFGNYLIHGWPVGRTGAQVNDSFTGGGIRLSRENAKELYASVSEGTPVLIHRTPSSPVVRFSYFRKSNLPHSVPEVPAAAVLAADIETGEILFEKNKNDKYPTASVTKLMTALVARRELASTTVLTVTKDALDTYGDSAGLGKGEEFKINDFYYGLILPSSNDAAKVFELAVPNFIEKMNAKARELKMTRTFFEDSSGLSQKNITSASDIFKLLQYIYQNDPELLAISSKDQYIITSSGKKRRHVWTNINWPRGDKRFLGGKAGWTDDALQTMAGVYLVRLTESGSRPIAIISLGTRERVSGIRSVINYLEQNFIYGAAVANDKQKINTVSSGASIYESIDGAIR